MAGAVTPRQPAFVSAVERGWRPKSRKLLVAALQRCKSHLNHVPKAADTRGLRDVTQIMRHVHGRHDT